MRVRQAEISEVEGLTALCRRSKAHWGYDAEFMRRSADALAVKPAAIAQGLVVVADDGGVPKGVAAVEPMEEDGVFDLTLLFVEPDAMGRGIGRTLFDAASAMAGSHGGTTMSILTDPSAAPFYEQMGARRVGEAPSDAIPGRVLPLYEYVLAPA